MASVYRTSSSIEVRAYAGRDPITGSVRNLYRSLPLCAHEHEITEAKDQLQATADRLKGSGEPFTLEGMLEFYFKQLEGQRSPTYIDGLRSNARCHLYPRLGQRQIDTIRPYEILELYSQMRSPEPSGGKGLSPNTIVKLNAWLSRAFSELAAMGILRRNPLEGVSSPSPEDFEAQPLSEHDLAAFSSYLKEQQAAVFNELDSALWLCLNTGLRAGELAGLRVSDVSIVQSEVRVSHSLARASGKGLFYKRPKSRAGRRKVVIGASTMDVVKQCVEVANSRSRAADPPLFCDEDGKPHDPRDFSKHFRTIADSLHIDKAAHLHTLRHTHATYLLMTGTPIRVVQERLGHADVRTTLKIYGHVLPGYDSAAASRFDSILNSLE